MLTRWKDEGGVAMVTVIMAMFVMVMISIAAFQLSIGNLSHSAYDRKRDEAIQAAQAAVNSYLAGLPITTRICNGVGTTKTLSSSPSITYKISTVYWSTNGSTWSTTNTTNTGSAGYCTSSSTLKYTSLGAGGKIVVIGSGTAGAGQQVVTRKWQTLVDLTAVSGKSTNAFFGNSGVCINNNPTILHNTPSGNDSTIYSGGDVDTYALCGNTNGNGSMIVEGNIYAQGNVALRGCVDGDIWAGGYVQLTNASVGSCSQGSYPSGYYITSNGNPVCSNGSNSNSVCYFRDSSGNNLGSITAAGGSITLSNSMGYGTCKASLSLVWDSNSRCSSTRDSTGFAPVACSGTIGDASTGCGTANASGLTAPNISDMPDFTYTPTDWSGTYAIVNETSGSPGQACPSSITTDIQNAVSNGVSGNYNVLFYINPGCALSFPNNTFTSSTGALRGNVVIITRGWFDSGNNTFTTATTTPSPNCLDGTAKDSWGYALYPDQVCQFDVMVPNDTVASPTTSCLSSPTYATNTAWPNITFGTAADLSGVDTFDYTPCWLNLNQQNQINGQGVAGVVNEGQSFKMSFRLLSLPGFSPTGYTAAPEYFRECVSGSSYC